MSEEEVKIETTTEQGEAEAKGLTPRNELFCQLYAGNKEFYGNGVQSYIEAYGIDIDEKGAYSGARASSSKLLTNTNILNRINDILEEGGLNDAFVDKQIKMVLTQNADLKAKMSAIKEYNAINQRITRQFKIEDDQETKDDLKEIINMLNNEISRVSKKDSGKSI